MLRVDVGKVEVRYSSTNSSGEKVNHLRQKIVVDGVPYERRGSEPIYGWNDIQDRHYKRVDDTRECPHVRCGNCFGSKFELFYGSCEISAKCVDCGKLDAVYDG